MASEIFHCPGMIQWLKVDDHWLWESAESRDCASRCCGNGEFVVTRAMGVGEVGRGGQTN